MSNKNLKENPFKRFFAVMGRGIVKAISKRKYVEWQYRYITHRKPNLENPALFTEKLQYLRLFVYPTLKEVSGCAGRVTVRDYVKSKGYESTLVPCLGIYDRFEDIDFESLPSSFVMKCSHASGWNLIVKDKSELDINKAKKQFRKWLRMDYGKKTVEPHYSPIKPQIIIEAYLGNIEHLPAEYKIHVFNGKARNLYVVTGRGEDIRYDQLYIDWTPFDESQFNGWRKSDKTPAKPEHFDEMVQIAEDLCKQFPFVRCDFYEIDGKIYFSEMTFTPAKGTLRFDDEKADHIMGEWLDISTYLKTK